MLDTLEKLLPYLKANHACNVTVTLAISIIEDRFLKEGNSSGYFDIYNNILDPSFPSLDEFINFNKDIGKFSWLRILRDGNYNKPKEVSDIAYDDLMEEVRKYYDNNNNELS